MAWVIRLLRLERDRTLEEATTFLQTWGPTLGLDPHRLCTTCKFQFSLAKILQHEKQDGPQDEPPEVYVGAEWAAIIKSAADGCVYCRMFEESVSSYYSRDDRDEPSELKWGEGPPEVDTWFSWRIRRRQPMATTAPENQDTFYLESHKPALRDFIIQFCLKCPSSDCHHISNTLVDDPLSQRGLTHIRKWMNDCKDTHVGCVTNSSQGSEMPTRILQINDADLDTSVKLIETNGLQVNYIALSHCWGPSELHPNKTTAATYAMHLNGIDFSSLSKTFQDAVKVSQALGIRYLWIDSLCIIQGDEADWTLESDRMGLVYANADLVIAAAGAEDGSQGLFRRAWSHPIVLQSTAKPEAQINAITYNKKKFGHDLKPRSFLNTDPNQNPLYKRGWAIQERLLAKRVLHFGLDEITFECRTSTRCECGDIDSLSTKSKFASVLRSSTNADDVNATWIEILDLYANSRLTFESDRLPAIKGLALTVAKPEFGRYLVGHWERFLPQTLLWSLYRTGNASTTEYLATKSPYMKAPTWSWVSQCGRHENWYDISFLSCDDKETVATYLSSSTDSEDTYHTITSGSLSINGPVITSHPLKTNRAQEIEGQVWFVLEESGNLKLSDQRSSPSLMILNPKDETMVRDVRLLVVMTGDRILYGLLLIEHENGQGREQSFQRIGWTGIEFEPGVNWRGFTTDLTVTIV